MSHIRALYYWSKTGAAERVRSTRHDRAIIACFIVASASLEIFLMFRATAIAMR
jgi:hypothetical protein